VAWRIFGAAAGITILIRSIYVYRLQGRPVYVGSADDVPKRDRQHSKGSGIIPFDREIARVGREAFTLEVLETVHGETKTDAKKAGVPRENYWMDTLGTYRTAGCFNFRRALVLWDSEEQRAASVASQKITMNRPGMHARLSAAVKIGLNRPGVKERHKDACARPEVRAAKSASGKIAQNRPEVRAKNSAAQKKAWERPEEVRRTGLMKIVNNRPATRAKNSASGKIVWNRPEMKAWKSAMMVREHRIRKLTKKQPMLPLPMMWRELYLGLSA